MTPLETYLHSIQEIRSTRGGKKETSYYGALESLFNEIGKNLKPKVRCVPQLVEKGAGAPDYGFFTIRQMKKSDTEPLEGQIPDRGVIEAKPIEDDAWVTAKTDQVSKYWKRYGTVLVTNYRDFLVIGKDDECKPKKFESFRLAESEKEFWELAKHPKRARESLARRFEEFATRVMLHGAPLEKPEDVAWFLASYARDAHDRIAEADVSTLAAFRSNLEAALGMKFEGEVDEKLFRSSFIQTLFYGVFSSWVLWAHERDLGDKSANFDWKQAAWTLHVPMVRVLYEEGAGPIKLRSLNLVEPLDWTAEVLNRVDREAFFSVFDQGEAVQYFYEPFLQQFDSDLRKRYGVWYTPPEIVKYMIARVHAVLREELGIEDGLADESVFVLDPCCGTGAFLVEVLKKIHETVSTNRKDALAANAVKEAAKNRVFGFEIMPAPFVVAHLQVGMLLQRIDAPLSHNDAERAAIYLTNALTDWEPPKDPKARIPIPMPELQEEKDAAGRIKQRTPILVVLGNPPYNAFAGTVTTEEEQQMIDVYKNGLNKSPAQGGWGIKKFNLDDLYVRFFRLAERRIAEITGHGVVCYISNFSYMTDPSFVVMRERFLGEFDKIWIDNLNGDSRETGKLTPEGKPDPSVFSTSKHSVGIQVGTAISLAVRRKTHSKSSKMLFRDLWGTSKREDLLQSLKAKRFDAQYTRATPTPENRFSFRPSKVSDHYMEWPKVVDLCAVSPSNGLMEKRGGALIDMDRDALARRMKAYFDPKLDWDDYKLLGYGLTQKQARFEPKAARSKAVSLEKFDPERIVQYAVRPFDVRWCYYTGVRPVWNEPRPSLWPQCWKGNRFITTRPAGVASPEGVPFYFTPLLGDNDFLRGHAYYFPMNLRSGMAAEKSLGPDLFDGVGKKTRSRSEAANASPTLNNYLSSAMLQGAAQSHIWLHVLAVGFAPSYLSENAEGVRQDWPRIPLPASKNALGSSAELGTMLGELLDSTRSLKGVTAGSVRPELVDIGSPTRIDGKSLNPKKSDLDIRAGWGHAGKEGVTMPGKGRIVEREYTKEERDAIKQGAKALGLSLDAALAELGSTTCDVYLNDVAFWKNVPKSVWEYVIGGYQVVKKWLSYREYELLGRGLTPDEVREVQDMCRRIAAILLMQPALNANYEAIKKDCFDWSSVAKSS